MAATHEVRNVPPERAGGNVLTEHPRLGQALRAAGVREPATAGLERLGELAAGAQARDWARLANSYPPVLRTHDRVGHRIDEVEFHPAWHQLMTVAVAHGLHGSPWVDAEPTAHLRRAVGLYVWGQVEQGHLCPVSMTYSVVPALRHQPELAAQYLPGLSGERYDFGLRPPGTKAGLLAGMAMTEKQGGSDVRANTTQAVPTADGSHRLTGHKWFCSAPMSDLFLVLAQEPDGLGCFLVPRVLPDASRNPFALQRLKDKLGNRSNASAEVEFDGTIGWRVGAAGRGLATILDMVTMTRLDCVISAAALQRAALAEARHHTAHRSAFGVLLADQPLMQEVLADLTVEAEASAALFLRLATALDRGEHALLRLAVAAAKFWVCRRTPGVVGEALECLGGAGFVEESVLPRLYREAPLNSIWEGSGNVLALDVLRAVRREPAAVAAVLAELQSAADRDPRIAASLAELERWLARLGTDRDEDERAARRLAARIAVLLQASALVSTAAASPAAAAVAERYLATFVADHADGLAGERGAASAANTRAVLAG